MADVVTAIAFSDRDVPHTSVPPEPAVAASSAAGTARVLTTEEIARRCERAIAIVSGRHAAGTGFLVRPGVLATNSHILAVERIEDLRVTFPAAKIGSMMTELLFEDPQRDLRCSLFRPTLPRWRLNRAISSDAVRT